ncbi:creatininase family protein [Turneriella parva]|uniref:Creatininase n=1 Tax=Turneriella parva (strain ATCC BAA-1111 / DSM 21527 / NCTC 11395 / H) TaxID=869212 RepID=I4B8E8_TURPD|nr:creatininase family protein [Turneriella parva]AFM13555.1 hypothetical protein Turpa_2916 [Turneriella parva DSM 21527]
MGAPELIFYDELPEKQLQGLMHGNILFLFINPTEYHGPHLPLANDYIISRGLAARLAPRLIKAGLTEKFIAAPLINLGLDPTPGAGTIATSAARFDTYLAQFARKLPLIGVSRVIVMTFHGAPRHNHAIQRFIDRLASAGISALNPLNLLLSRMLTYKPGDFAAALAPVKDAKAREQLSAHLGHDYHAGFFETSLTLALAPQTVDPSYTELPDCPEIEIPAWQRAAIHGIKSLGQASAARELAFAAEAMAWLNLEPFPGYTGMPRYANRKSGDIFVNEILDIYEEAVRAVFVDGKAAPQPELSVTDFLSGLAGL